MTALVGLIRSVVISLLGWVTALVLARFASRSIGWWISLAWWSSSLMGGSVRSDRRRRHERPGSNTCRPQRGGVGAHYDSCADDSRPAKREASQETATTHDFTYNDVMGFDRGVLPPDRDREETFPWMGVVAAILILGGIAAFVYFFILNPDEDTVESSLRLIGVI